MHAPFSASDDARFDRLVDGALSAAEYQALLASLDDEPGGWRRCALAFLEAQALGQELAPRPSERKLPPVEIVPSQSPRSRGVRPYLALAAAASFVLAFLGGVFTARHFAPPAPMPLVATREEPTPSQPTAPRAAGPEITPTRYAQPIGQAHLEFQASQSAPKQQLEVPVYLAGAGNEQMLTNTPLLSPQVIEAFERHGHRVEYEQRLLPVTLGDGRQVVFPVEQYQITPVSTRSY